MKRILFSILFILISVSVKSQNYYYNGTLQKVTSAPTGPCTNNDNPKLLVPDGVIYTCQNGTWGPVSGGSGGGTVTSVATNATLTGGPITDSGTLGLNLTHANTWTGLQSGTIQASTVTEPTPSGIALLGYSSSGVFGDYQNTDGTLTFNSSGSAPWVMGCATATTSQAGCVKPDGTTITVTGGVISAVSGGTGNVNASGTLTNNGLVIGQGTTDVATVPALGTDGTATIFAGDATNAGTFTLYNGASGGKISLQLSSGANTGGVLDFPDINTTDVVTTNAATQTLTNKSIAASEVNSGTLDAARIPTGISITGNAATATALAANPTDCSTNQFATTIAANGNLTCAQPSFSNLSGTATSTQLPVATTSANGAVRPDGTTITISGGIISAVNSSGISGSGTTGYIPAFSGSTAIEDSHLDDGITTAGVITSTEPIAIPSDGTHAGAISLIGNTTEPTLSTGSVNLIGPNNASVTAYGLQFPATLGAGVLHAGTPSSSISQITSSAVSLTTDVSGTLPITNGGTGQTSASAALSALGGSPAVTVTTGTGTVTANANNTYVVCTSTCTVTIPIPAAGKQICVLNDDNVGTVITLAALGSSAMYENTARTAYGTAGTGTLVSSGAVGDSVCIVGRDTTHYLTLSSTGSWTAN